MSETLRHLALKGVMIDIMDNREISGKEELEKLMETHYLINEDHEGIKVNFTI